MEPKLFARSAADIEIGMCLREMRLKRGLSRAQAGKQAGRDARFVEDIEKARGPIGYRDTKRLLTIYGATVADLPY